MIDGRLDRTALTRLRQSLAQYQAVLPSLDSKRRQLSLEVSHARRRIAELSGERDAVTSDAARRLPMAASADQLPALVVSAVDLLPDSRCGISLPRVGRVSVTEATDRDFVCSPAWMEEALEQVRRIAIIGVQERVERIRLARLERALAETVRRVNLFERVLIPDVQTRIRRIVIGISDAGRDAMVRAKRSKAHGSSGRWP